MNSVTYMNQLDMMKNDSFFLQIDGEELTAEIMLAQIHAVASLCEERGAKLKSYETGGGL